MPARNTCHLSAPQTARRAIGHTMRIASTLAILLIAFAHIALAQTPGENTDPPKKRLVADYVYWSKWDNPAYDASNIPFKKLTHIIHAGINFNDDGTLSVPDGFLEPELIGKAHYDGVKVMVLFGGNVPILETKPEVLKPLVANLKKFVEDHQYDGLDLDWEYPTTDADTAELLTFMTALRKALPSPRYLLSIDAAPWTEPSYDVPHVRKVIDWFNIMTYDCAGPWTAHAQLNSPIFWDPSNPAPYECEPGASDQESADIFLADAPASQLNQGTPFYGYEYTNVKKLFGLCPNAATTDDGDCDDAVITLDYGNEIKQLVDKDGWVQHRDSKALVPYLLRKDGSPGFITYDDPKSTYTRVWYSDWQRGLGGTFMWSLDGDYDGESQVLLDAMYQATNKLPPCNDQK